MSKFHVGKSYTETAYNIGECQQGKHKQMHHYCIFNVCGTKPLIFIM